MTDNNLSTEDIPVIVPIIGESLLSTMIVNCIYTLLRFTTCH